MKYDAIIFDLYGTLVDNSGLTCRLHLLSTYRFFLVLRR
jgi:FMN phosphatase YigB (HAD superfamily)